MSHYEERLQKDLAHIGGKLADLSNAVETALQEASHALLKGDSARAYTVILGDHPINRASRALDRICHGFIAVHLPSAGHLRYVSSVMRANLELERIGDYAVNICRETAQLGHPPEGGVLQLTERLADTARHVLRQALSAFNNANPDQARETIALASLEARAFAAAFEELMAQGDRLEVHNLFAYLVVFNSLGRVVDQAKNICEEAVFALTGETKAAKIYRVLFLDEDNATLGPLAQAVAGKGFPNSGTYSSAGRQAAASINPLLVEFMEERGIALPDQSPQTLDPQAADLADYHVIVSLQGPVKSYLDPIPFHTIALQWDLEGVASGDAPFESVYRSLALQIRDLMTTLRGEEDA